MSTEQRPAQTARFFTSARRISLRFGKLPNGGRIWGGPYTLVQVAAGSTVLLVGWWTTPIWGPSVGTPLTQILVLAVCAGATLWGSGKIPSTRRKIPDLLVDGFSAVTVPGAGRYQGRPVKLTPPRYYGGTVLILDDLGTVTATRVSSTSTQVPAHIVIPQPTELPMALPANVIPIPPSTRYLTGMDRLLEQARRKESN